MADIPHIVVQARRVAPSRLSARRIWVARGVAVAADVLQIAVFPLFSEGAFSMLDLGLDIFMAVLMTLLVGWHIAFVPTAIVEVLPFADLAPTWTIAVFIATRKGSVAGGQRPPESGTR